MKCGDHRLYTDVFLSCCTKRLVKKLSKKTIATVWLVRSAEGNLKELLSKPSSDKAIPLIWQAPGRLRTLQTCCGSHQHAANHRWSKWVSNTSRVCDVPSKLLWFFIVYKIGHEGMRRDVEPSERLEHLDISLISQLFSCLIL